MKVYSSETLRKEHLKLCEGINKGAQMIQMPKPGEMVEFTDGHKLLKAPFIVYADFECFNAKKDDVDFKNPCEDDNCEMCLKHKKRTIQSCIFSRSK